MTQNSLLNKDALSRLVKEKEVKNLVDFNHLVGELSKEMIETILQGEQNNFLGYDKYDHQGKSTSNSRNGFSSKSVSSTFGPMDIKVPRDREGKFEPQLVRKGQREISFFDKTVVSLYAKGLSTRDISRHVKEIYNYEISPETVSTITEGIMERAHQWQSRGLESVYSIAYLDGFFLKIRIEGHVRSVSVYAILGINLSGEKECLGLWVGAEAESSKYWLSVLNELKNRGVEDVLIFCVDNLTGISEAIAAAFPKAEIQKCIVHQIRNSLKFVSYKDKKALCSDLKSVYKACSEESALSALDGFESKWGKRYPNIGSSWRRNWSELSTFFKYPEKIRRLIYTTNPIESMNRGFRKVTKTKSIFPTQEAAFKVLYLTVEETSKKWTGRLKDWSEIYPQLLVFFRERLEKYQ